jgi:hypothetical protein
MWARAGCTAALLVTVQGAGAGAVAAQRFNWDAIGAAYCQHAVAEEIAAMGAILTPSLRLLIEAAGRRANVPPRMLLQSYDAQALECRARTRNAAIIEVERAVAGGGTSWTDYLVVVPEADGSTRIDDILFSTRRSDTLRSRLAIILGQ